MKTGKHTVTALTREQSKAKFADGLLVVRVNYDDESSIIKALKGQQFLVTTLSVKAPKDLGNRIYSAAKKAGVPYILPNGFGYPIDDDLTKAQPTGSYGESVRQAALQAQGATTSWFILACGFWYEWSLACGETFFGFTIKDRKVTFFDDGKRLITVSTWDQCGRALAALLSLPESGASPSLADFRNKNVAVYSFQVSQRGMLNSLHRVLGTTDADWEIKYEPLDKWIPEGRAELANGVRSGFGKILYGDVFLPTNPASDYGTRPTANAALGLSEEDVDSATKRTVDMVESGWTPF